jgi:hypothetical protein
VFITSPIYSFALDEKGLLRSEELGLSADLIITKLISFLSLSAYLHCSRRVIWIFTGAALLLNEAADTLYNDLLL